MSISIVSSAVPSKFTGFFGPRLSDIRLADVQIRLLINFNTIRLTVGIQRFVL